MQKRGTISCNSWLFAGVAIVLPPPWALVKCPILTLLGKTFDVTADMLEEGLYQALYDYVKVNAKPLFSHQMLDSF